MEERAAERGEAGATVVAEEDPAAAGSFGAAAVIVETVMAEAVAAAQVVEAEVVEADAETKSQGSQSRHSLEHFQKASL